MGNLLGWTITTVGCGLFILFDLHTKSAVFAIALAIFGIGNGMVLTGVNVGTQAISKVENRSMAACMYGFMRSLGMPIGVALSGTIFHNTMSHALFKSSLPPYIAQDSARYISVLRTMAQTDPKKIAILQCYIKGFHAVFAAMTAVSASALVLSLLIKSFSMDIIHLEASRVR